MKAGSKVLSVMIACSLLTSSFAGTAAFAAANRKDPEEGAAMGKRVSSYSSRKMDISYMLNGAPVTKKALARAASEELPEAYNAVESGAVTPEVRNQGSWGTCWSFSANGAMASDLYADMGDDAPVLAPVHLAYFAFHGRSNPSDPADKTDGDTYRPFEYKESDADKKFQEYVMGGNTFIATATLSRGEGPVLEEDLPYPTTAAERDAYEDLDPEIQFNQEYRLESTNYLPTRDADGKLDGTAVKKALLEGGSLGISYNTRGYNYNVDYNGQKIKTQFGGMKFGDCNHAVQIVGWDDNVPKELFTNYYGTPENDGAWIIRNSWGVDEYGGYFYMSYDEGSITEVMQYNLDKSGQEYDHLYQYDGTGWSMSAGAEEKDAPVSMANVFTATSDETLKAVSFYTTDANAEYSIQVYTQLPTGFYKPTQGIKAYKEPITGTEAYPGYHTVALDEDQFVNLSKGEKYAVVVTLENPLGRAFPIATEMNGNFDNVRCVAAINARQSYLSIDGEDWQDVKTIGTNYTAIPKRNAGSSSAEDLQGKPGTSGVNIEVAGDFDGDMWGALGNVCLKAFTTEGQEGFDPVEAPSVKVKYSVGADIKANGDIDETYDFPGYYEGKVYAGDTAVLSFVPYAEGREFAGVTVNGTADEAYEKNLYTYEVKGGEEDTALDFSFTIVNKLVLNTAVQFAKEAQKGEEYAAAMPTVQKLIDEALAAGVAVAESKTADQAAIDKAWKDLIDVIQLLQFRNGDMTELAFQLEMAGQMDPAYFTADSWNAMIAVRDKAQAMFDAKDSLQEDIDAMAKELKEAITNLVYKATKESLENLVKEAQSYDLEKYLDTGKAEFQTALAAAVELLKNADATQSDYNVMESRLAIAMAALRKIPDSAELDELLERFANMNASDYTEETYAAYSASVAALAELVNSGASPEAVTEAYYEAIEKENELAANPNVPASKPSKPSGGSGGSSGGGSSYGGAGTAVVGANVAQVARVVSDTTVNFSLKRGAAYCFKMTVVNGNGQVPSFTVGNGDVLKTQFVAQIGNDYYYRVWAVGAPGQSTGVYTALAGASAVKHCAVTIA
ncbi:lectin like domain-containing protein [Anaeromassilibacillus senegalensis]|uniref:lectin like domain-containing protein n=1 Tax=Anaeromassilibacillus senegalensis TaxID=1673717 RepID=UPI000680E535|nr:lectin like domain-containing protein [Anaeromassilibacillus senegalensis]